MFNDWQAATVDKINIVSYYTNVGLTWLTYYVTYIFEEFREFSTVVKIAAIGLTFCVLLILWTLGRLVYQWFRNRRLNKVYKKLDERFGEGVRYILSPEAKPNMNRKEELEALDLKESDLQGKSILKDYRERLCMSRLIYRARISEDASLGRRKNLHVLLRIFGIQEFLEHLINKDRMRLKTESLHMIRAFKLPINPWVANQLMNSKRFRVRRLAMYTSIMSSSNMDLEYYESEFFDENCCIYDEIQLGYVLKRRKHARRKIPNLAILALKQKNPSTQCVFVRLMRQFNQKENCSELEELFQLNSNSELIEEISRTWGYLKYTEGEDLINEVLLTQSDDTKIALMHALTRMGTGKSINALIDGYQNNGDPRVRYEALRCLWNYGEAGRAKFHELENSATTADRFLFDFFHNDITKEEIPLSKSDSFKLEYGENLYTVV